MISVPVFVWLGYWLWGKFKDDVTQLERMLSKTHSYSLMVAGVVFLVVVLVVIGIVRKARVNWDE